MDTEGIRIRTSGLRSAVKDTVRDIASSVDPPQPASQTQDRAFNLAQVHDTVSPLFVALATIVGAVEPILDRVSDLVQTVWKALEPYHPEDLFVALYGFLLVFFGGVYMTLVASFEAAHIFGWANIKMAVRALYYEWGKARAAFERDNKVCCCISNSLRECTCANAVPAMTSEKIKANNLLSV